MKVIPRESAKRIKAVGLQRSLNYNGRMNEVRYTNEGKQGANARMKKIGKAYDFA